MAQAPSQTQPSSSRTLAANRAQSRGGSLVSRDLRSAWAASPFSLMQRLSSDLDELFGPLRFMADAPVDWIPAIEAYQRDGKFVVQADLPGLQPDQVTVEIDDKILTLSGERSEEQEIDQGGARRTERRYGRFTRSIALPEGARTEEVQASFRNGVLEITVPLSQSSQQRRVVEIQNASDQTAKSQGDTGAQAATTGGPQS